jgi:hypothetical protein
VLHQQPLDVGNVLLARADAQDGAVLSKIADLDVAGLQAETLGDRLAGA